MPFFAPAQLGLPHIQFIVQALYELAETDGIHATEKVMLRGFYDQCRDDAKGLTSFEELIRCDFDAGRAAELFATEELKACFLQSCVLLAYADGRYSSGERAKVRSYADMLEVSADNLAQLEEAVSDHLLQQIAVIENVEAVQRVAAELSNAN